jgi:ribonuclease BN (tRNA processing enzyme)
MRESIPPKNSVTFLGSGGARFMMISQKLATGGLWFNLDGTDLLVDPGPGCITQVARQNFQAEQLDAILLSHRHLDHSADVNIMVEAMVRGGFHPHGYLYAPADALVQESVILQYLRDLLDGVIILSEGRTYRIGGIEIEIPLRHHHGVETYGFRFRVENRTVAYVADTKYFQALASSYRADLMIVCVLMEYSHPHLDHLSVRDATAIIGQAQPRTAILTHFGMGLWRGGPENYASYISAETGVHVIAACDGMCFRLSDLD